MPGSGQDSIKKSATAEQSEIALWGREWLHLRRNLCLLLLLALTGLLTGCGGGSGGGGGGTKGNGTSVSGVILQAEDDSALVGATINVGGVQGTSASDGSFLLSNVSSTVTSATLTPPSGSSAIKRTLVLALTKGIANNLGYIYTSQTGYTATAVGTVVAPIGGNTTAVVGATVTIAGAQVVTVTNGAFTIPNLPVGLGQADPNTPIGIISAAGFEPKPIYAQYALAAGSNDLGPQLLGAPIGNAAPSVPYTIQGKVTVKGIATPGVNVYISNSAGTQLSGTSSDANGNYTFWVIPGTYTIQGLTNNTTSTVTVMLAALNVPVTAPPIQF